MSSVIVPLRALLRRIKFMALFLMMTYAVAHIMGAVSDWIYPVDKYREPHGQAVKVFRWEDGLDREHMTFTERLRLYYWLGE